MSWIFTNPNTVRKTAGDCVVRAMCVAENASWEQAYDRICAQGRIEHEMPSANVVLDSYLKRRGYRLYYIPYDVYRRGYTVRDFANEHRNGTYILATGTHVVAVIDGNFYDAWNSGNEKLKYYWRKEPNQLWI